MTSGPATGQCRLCGTTLEYTMVDLGMSPLANSFVDAAGLDRMEPFYPLRVFVCGQCLLVQVKAYETSEHIFSEYLYFSSFSSSWLDHAKAYTDAMIGRFGLGAQSQVVEIASNDGYLLQFFAKRGVPVLGIEPARNIAKVAEQRGVPTHVAFFDQHTAKELADCGVRADLIVNNNVLAHVPDLHGFIAGWTILLKPGGVITVEFPHVLELIRVSQFDTIYHEHFSYLSLRVAVRALAEHGLMVFDVEQLPTHGGSLRVFAAHRESQHAVCASVADVLKMETEAGLDQLDGYDEFALKAVKVKCDLLDFLIRCKRDGLQVVGYGAPAKGNTLLNYAGVGPELLPYTVDRSPYKQGRFLPGVHIPIHAPERIFETRPEYVLILPWNLREEIAGAMKGIRAWGGKFVVAIPELEVF